MFRLTNSWERDGLGKNKGLPSNHQNDYAAAKDVINKRTFPCIGKESPSSTEIQQLLTKERGHLKIRKPKNSIVSYDYFKDMGNIYEMTYAFVAEFQKNDIPSKHLQSHA